MRAPTTDLVHGYLDETLSAEQQDELANWIKDNPEHARQFAEIVLLHDRLRAELKEAVQGARAFLVILSPAAVSSAWVQKEKLR